MNNITVLENKFDVLKFAIIDILLISFAVFAPSLSHFFSLPLYYAEPMRVVILLSLIYTNKNNSIVLSILIPFLSFIISSHPYLLKSGLIAFELTINIVAFFVIVKYMKNIFLSILTSVIISKILYYALKAFMLNFGFISGSLISTPLLAQALSTLGLSLIFLLLFNIKNKKK